MTDTQDLIARLRTVAKYLRTDRQELNDAVILEAADALESSQAEIERKSESIQKLWKERDAALARLAEVEAHHKEVLSDLDARINYAESRKPTIEKFESWWRSSKYMQVVFSDQNARQVALDGWNAAAGASPVQPSQAGLSDEEAKELWLYEAGKSGYNTHELPARFLRAATAAINAKGGN